MRNEREPQREKDEDSGKLPLLVTGTGIMGTGLFLIGAGIKAVATGESAETAVVCFSAGSGMFGIGLYTAGRALDS